MKKKIHLTKDKAQLIADLQKNQKWVVKMKFAKDQLYPALLEVDTDIDDLKSFLSSINGIILEKFLSKMKEFNFSDLNLIDVLDKKDKNHDSYVKILKLFDNYSIFDTKDTLEGMKSELDLFILDEMKTRKLSSFKTKWLDEL